MVNVKKVSNIEAGAFNESMVSLKSFHIEDASDGPGSSSLVTGAFEALQNVRRINLGKSFLQSQDLSTQQLEIRHSILTSFT